MRVLDGSKSSIEVALRKESVDRNTGSAWVPEFPELVALRKESVDRNVNPMISLNTCRVALRKESVDRNTGGSKVISFFISRSPQGERG